MPCSTNRVLAEAMPPCTCERCAIQSSLNRYERKLRDDVSFFIARAVKAGGGGGRVPSEEDHAKKLFFILAV